MFRQSIIIALSVFFAASAHAQNVLSVATFNVESDLDTDQVDIAADFAKIPPLHVWALQEVADQATLDFYVAEISRTTGIEYAGYLSPSGALSRDHLAFIYAPEVFANPTFVEEERIGGDITTISMRADFMGARSMTLVNNYFDRGDARARQGQARSLASWIDDHEDEAIIILGTLNFDYKFQGRRTGGNRAFELFSAGQNASWPEPMCIANETCPVTGDQCNPQYRNFLNFIFLGGSAMNWRARTDLAFLDDANYCDREDEGGSDNYPTLAQILVE